MGDWVRSHLKALWGEKGVVCSSLLSEMALLRLVVESRAKRV